MPLLQIPVSAPNISRFRRNLRNYPRDSSEVMDYSNQFSVRTFLDRSIWVPFDEVLLETPLKEVSDKTRILQINNSVEASDEDYIYFLKIFEYKLIGETALLSLSKKIFLTLS